MSADGHGELGANSLARGKSKYMCLETVLPSITSTPRSLKAKEVNWASQSAEILITQGQAEHWAPYPRSKKGRKGSLGRWWGCQVGQDQAWAAFQGG